MDLKRSIYTTTVTAGRVSGYRKFRGLPDRAGSLRVLMYHKVTHSQPNTIAVHPDSFAAQQAFLAEHYCIVGLDDVIAAIDGSRMLPRRAVLLTFDDGYLDNITNAYPVLRRHGHRAVMFVCAHVMDGQSLPHDAHLPTANPTTSWDHLRATVDVFDVASHALTHRTLSSLDDDDVRREILESKDVIETNLGRRVRAFAYPKGSAGDYGERETSLVRAAGYEVAFCTTAGANLEPFNRYEIRRHNVEDFGMRYFEALLDGSAELLMFKDTRLGYRAKRLAKRLLPARAV